jgi:hypothetical protein
MRIDIEYSPGARGQRMSAAAREIDGLGTCRGRMNEKRLCSMDHPASWSGERASRFFAERSVGVLWHHSSVNLVGPRSIALAGPKLSDGCRRSLVRLASRQSRRNRCDGCFPSGSEENDEILGLVCERQFSVNHDGVIQAFGFNDLAGGNE